MLIVDSFSDLFKIAIIFTTISIFIVSKYSSEVDEEYKNEYYMLLLSMCLGMLLLVSSTNLIMIYLSMELIGIPSYILAGMNKKDKLSNEASLKYIIYGSFASGVMLFGFSWDIWFNWVCLFKFIKYIPTIGSVACNVYCIYLCFSWNGI